VRLNVFLLSLLSLCASAFGAPKIELVEVAVEGKQPRIAVGPQGEMGIVYGFDGAVYFRRVDSKGKLFEPVRVAYVSPMALGMRRGPQIAITQSSFIVTAIDRGAGNLLSWRSQDLGKTWEGPMQVNEIKGSAVEGLHTISKGKKDLAMVVWQEKEEFKGQKVFASRTLDGGKSWSKGILVYQSPEGSVCPCCHPSITSDASGNFFAMWRNSLGGNRDLYWAKFDESKNAFGSAEKLGVGSWKFNACPMDGGSLLVQPDGKLLTVWRREKQVFTALTGEPEKLLATGTQPVIARGEKLNHFAWQAGEKLYYKNSDENTPVIIGTGAYPSIVATSQGCIVVFERIKGTTIGVGMALISSP
jgi:hypothetical protein